MRIAYDCTLRRPGCVLVQAAFGCDPQPVQAFDTRYWLTAPTPDLRVYEVTPEQLDRLVAITEEANP